MLDHVDQQALAKGHEITGGMAGARNSWKQHKSIMLSCSCLVSGLDVGSIKILTEMKERPNPQYPAFPKIYILSILYNIYICILLMNTSIPTFSIILFKVVAQATTRLSQQEHPQRYGEVLICHDHNTPVAK